MPEGGEDHFTRFFLFAVPWMAAGALLALAVEHFL